MIKFWNFIISLFLMSSFFGLLQGQTAGEVDNEELHCQVDHALHHRRHRDGVLLAIRVLHREDSAHHRKRTRIHGEHDQEPQDREALRKVPMIRVSGTDRMLMNYDQRKSMIHQNTINGLPSSKSS